MTRWGQPYKAMGVTTSDVDEEGQIKPDAPETQLYNLATDPGQTTNVVGQHPERAAEMGGGPWRRCSMSLPPRKNLESRVFLALRRGLGECRQGGGRVDKSSQNTDRKQTEGWGNFFKGWEWGFGRIRLRCRSS